MEQEFFEVIEINQWMASRLSNIRDINFDSFNYFQVDGPDTDSTKKILVGMICMSSYWKGKVRKDDMPTLGYVWFIKGPDGKMLKFKSNIDSSD